MRHAQIDSELFTANRRRLVAVLPPNAIAIVHAADVLPTSGDGTLKVQPASDLFWLSGIEQEESVLVLCQQASDPGAREILFVRQPTEQLATWEGDKLTKEKARAISGITKVRWLSDLPAALHALVCESETVWLNGNEHERAAYEVEDRDLRLARKLIQKYPLHRYERLAPLMRRLRAVKSPAEVALLRRAVDITDVGLRRVLSVLKPGVMEYELEAELASEFLRRRSRMAYEPIIGSGKNACVLHYLDNEAECRSGELVLIDVGASYANYCADLTRTYPVSGTFTPRQRAVYEAVLRVLTSSITRSCDARISRSRARSWGFPAIGSMIVLMYSRTAPLTSGVPSGRLGAFSSICAITSGSEMVTSPCVIEVRGTPARAAISLSSVGVSSRPSRERREASVAVSSAVIVNVAARSRSC